MVEPSNNLSRKMNKVVKRGNLKRTDFMTTISDRKIINNMVHYKMEQGNKTRYWALDEIQDLGEVVRYEASLREYPSDEEELQDFPENQPVVEQKKISEDTTKEFEYSSSNSSNRSSPKRKRSAKISPEFDYTEEDEQSDEEPVKPPVDMTEWEVDEIIDKRRWGRGFQYKVIWKYWPRKSATWEPSRNLTNCDEKIQEFERKLAELE